jgi:hypothetical protein
MQARNSSEMSVPTYQTSIHAYEENYREECCITRKEPSCIAADVRGPHVESRSNN